ncbi:MAG: LptF/LptG family permease [Candidatus Edwardsbacteria bacterium]
MQIIDRYILKEHLIPFLLGFSVFTFILFMDRLFELIDLIVGKGLALFTVLEVFFLSLPFMIALTVPMAVLVASLMAFGRLSQDNEIIAFKSSGLLFLRLIRAPFFASIILFGLMILFNDRILPESNHKVKNLLIDINQKRPALRLKEGTFMSDFEGYNIWIKRIDSRQSKLYDIVIYEKIKDGTPRTITAKKANLYYSAENKTLTLQLSSGEIHEVDAQNPANYRKLVFPSYTINLPLDLSFQRQEREYRSDREMTIAMMEREIARLKKEYEIIKRIPPKLGAAEILNLKYKQMEIDRYKVEIHKKFAIPFACFIFVFLGSSLGVLVKKGGAGIGFGLSLGFFLLYYICLIGGEELADRQFISPFLAMWGANIILGILSIYLVWRTVHEH